ncbi:bem46 protein, variant [Spiromyces aspiralis]|uniref:Bem46 protein, variant n=1 Tax=Spiromyces aspiralis TaxID=68401 RepID=A0ACC1HWQ4_9FUNG|nr:bem46 protein, variant [Spiromyces aspiralis]
MVTSLLALGLGALWLFQRDLVYPASFPATSRERVPLPSQYDMPYYDDIHMETADGVKIRGYLIKRPTDDESRRAPTVLYLQANAGNIGHRLPIAKMLYDSLGCNLFLLSYRGYGLSEGKPSEAGLRTDASTALEFIRTHPLTANTKLVVYGQSLGGAIAIDLVAREPDEFVGMILENTFLSIPKLIPSVMPMLRHLSFLSSERWDSENQLKLVRQIPILLLSGEQDDLVPPEHMKRLHEIALAYNEKPVIMETFPEGKHNDTCIQPGYFDKIKQWWDSTMLSAPEYKPTGRRGGELTKVSGDESEFQSKEKVNVGENATLGSSDINKRVTTKEQTDSEDETEVEPASTAVAASAL